MMTCKDLFPQLAEKMAKCGEAGKLPLGCSTAAGPVCGFGGFI